MNYYREYRLKKDTPTHVAGWAVRWSGMQRKFFPVKIGSPFELDTSNVYYTVEQVKNTEWFEPIGQAYPFIPAFPTFANIKEFMYLLPELRLVDDVDECRAISDLLNDPSFERRLYDFYKAEYNAFHGILTEAK